MLRCPLILKAHSGSNFGTAFFMQKIVSFIDIKTEMFQNSRWILKKCINKFNKEIRFLVVTVFTVFI